MSSKFVREAFFAETQAWAATQSPAPQVVQIYDPLEFYPPSRSGGAFIALQFGRAPEIQASIGAPESNLYREEGVIFLHVVFPAGGRTGGVPNWDYALDLAESARSFYRARRFDAIRCYDVDPPELGEGASIRIGSGIWQGAVIAIDYEYDVQGGQ